MGERRESLHFDGWETRSPSSSSGYSSSTSTSPPPPHCSDGNVTNNGDRRSSWYGRLSRNEQGGRVIPDHSLKQPSSVTSRTVDLVNEAKLLQRDCQFVKKVIDSGGGVVAGGPPTYLRGDQLGETGESLAYSCSRPPPMDPRPCRGSSPWMAPALRGVLLDWDEANSRGPPPPRELLLEGVSLPSKALLVTLIEAATGMTQLASLIEEVQLAPDCALLLMRDPGSAVRLLKRLMGKALGALGGEAVRVRFDPGSRQFVRQRNSSKDGANQRETLNHRADGHGPVAGTVSRQDHQRRQSFPAPSVALLLKCSRRVPCLLIDYRDVPADESVTCIEEIFHKCRIFNVERSDHQWHVHLASQGEIDYVRRWREAFIWRGRPIPFVLRTFERPPLLSRGSEQADEERKHLEGEQGSRGESTEGLLGYQRNPSILSLDQLYGQKHVTGREGSEGWTHMSINDHIDGSLPIFNKRYLERARDERSQGRGKGEEEYEYDDGDIDIDKDDHDLKRERKEIPVESQRKMYTKEDASSRIKEGEDDLEEISPAKASPGESPLKARKLAKAKRLKTGPSLDSQPAIVMTGPSLAGPTRTEFARPPTHRTGCARTEGYYEQRPEDKIVYWEDITKGMEEGSCLTFDARATSATVGTSIPSTMTGRSARAQNRRLHWETSSAAKSSLATADYFGKTSALAARMKKLVLGRSSIHSWGLFAGEDIEAGDMVIEYVGEIIRHSVANVRERKYELALRAQGSKEMASSYFFRLDADLVVDATHKGNLSRFINHSCDPSCLARVLTLDGARRIVMYTRRDIRRGEELTYDYKFPLEDDPAKKIICLCGARNCRGTLN